MLQVPAWKRGLKGEVLGRDALPALVPAWEELCDRSVEDNVYYSPRYARALLESAERDRAVHFAVVWDQAKLIALLPVTRQRAAIPLLQAAGRAWQSKYTFSCTPLLDRARTCEAAESLLDVLATIGKGEWVLGAVNTEGEACRAVTTALAGRRSPWLSLGRFERPSLEAGLGFDDHLRRHLRPSRRKDFTRNRKRLEQMGRVEHQTHTCGPGLDRAVEAFLRIEASGWKGRRGTALACDERTRRFALGAFGGQGESSMCRADVLTVDSKPIAVSLIACAGRTGFAVKSCFDEAYRHCSPGLLLEMEVIRGFLSGDWASRLDSATSEPHILDGLWPGRVAVADLMFSLAPQRPDLRLSALRLADETRRTLKAGLKRCANAARESLERARAIVEPRRSADAAAETARCADARGTRP